MLQLFAHLLGDYFLQSDWMAVNKSKRSLPCIIHVALYTLTFLLITTSLPALALIGITHFFIDRFGLARYVVYAKNWVLNPPTYRKPWVECMVTGFDPDRPIWLTVWLLIVVDNAMHLMINYFALRYL